MAEKAKGGMIWGGGSQKGEGNKQPRDGGWAAIEIKGEKTAGWNFPGGTDHAVALRPLGQPQNRHGRMFS